MGAFLLVQRLPNLWNVPRARRIAFCQSLKSPRRRAFFLPELVMYSGKLPTDCLQATEKKKPHYRIDSGVSFVLAEREGFEPSVMLPPRLISSQVHSTTLPPLLCVEACDSSRIFQGANTATPPM